MVAEKATPNIDYHSCLGFVVFPLISLSETVLPSYTDSFISGVAQNLIVDALLSDEKNGNKRGVNDLIMCSIFSPFSHSPSALYHLGMAVGENYNDPEEGIDILYSALKVFSKKSLHNDRNIQADVLSRDFIKMWQQVREIVLADVYKEGQLTDDLKERIHYLKSLITGYASFPGTFVKIPNLDEFFKEYDEEIAKALKGEYIFGPEKITA